MTGYSAARVMMSAMLVAATLTGCQKTVDRSREAAAITKRTVHDAASFWKDVFTYTPDVDQAPQTRYCYQMQSDIVCYDSLQAHATSKLVGYQDGEQISWVQPGGGSLGVSGGEPVAAVDASANHAADATPAFINGVGVETPKVGTIRAMNLPPASK